MKAAWGESHPPHPFAETPQSTPWETSNITMLSLPHGKKYPVRFTVQPTQAASRTHFSSNLINLAMLHNSVDGST